MFKSKIKIYLSKTFRPGPPLNNCNIRHPTERCLYVYVGIYGDLPRTHMNTC